MFKWTPRPRKALSILLTPFPCAVLLCLANLFKPALIDDFPYLNTIPAILDNPAQPYGPPPDGFQTIWYQEGQGAFTLLIPMVLPYWLALGACLFGNSLVCLKLSLFPFCLVLTASMSSLLRRFAPGYVGPILAATIFSPAILPGLNVMLDIPALALSLAALVVFLTAIDRDRSCWLLVLVSGLLAGLAGQTKYTGLTIIPAIALAALVNRRWLAGIAAVVVAASLFAGWEAYLTHVYGRSHFLEQADNRRDKPSGSDDKGFSQKLAAEIDATYVEKKKLFGPLFCYLGGTAIGLTGILLAALRLRRTAIATAGTLFMAFLLTAFIPDSWVLWYGDPDEGIADVTFSSLLFGVSGSLFVILVVIAMFYLGFRGWRRLRIRIRWSSPAWFLIGWFTIELFAYFALSPFPAMRRVLGVFIVGTLVAGRLVSLTGRSRARRAAVGILAGLGVCVGVLFAITDFRDARVDRRAVRDSIELIRRQPGGNGNIWFTGHWGFQYYAVRAGLREIYPGQSIFNEGDWIIDVDDPARQDAHQTLDFQPGRVEEIAAVDWSDAWRWRTIPDYFIGYQPIRRHEGPRLHLTIFRVKKPFRAEARE